ncbi:MAG TPA: SIS domain-containing protein [Candidatus Cybelea sp.]|jgi:D-sedoheptulose 7-phosphate isomerase|nr:SIS domain-containing protein [Candidatus Cybelea sp.]
MLTSEPPLVEFERWIADRFAARNAVAESFFPAQARPLALACRQMFERFHRGGRLLAFGRGAYATDAQHVSVEFVHPVIVGKRALPAMDLSLAFASWVDAVLEPDDIVMGFGPPGGDAEVLQVLDRARARGALTFALPGTRADYAVAAPSDDPHVHQEMIEILCHTLYETVHVFFEHREMGHDVGAAAFLYPFLGERAAPQESLIEEVASSVLAKSQDASDLRAAVVANQLGAIAHAATAIAGQLRAGGKLMLFGNGGSATDATDWALDCVMPEDGARPIRAVSLSLEPAIITAVANDVGTEVIFLRQLVAQARPHDVAIALSTSGGSKNIVAALQEARKRGLLTVALLGYDGGEVVRSGLADIPIVVHCDYIPRIQEVQGTIYHIIRESLELLGRHAA